MSLYTNTGWFWSRAADGAYHADTPLVWEIGKPGSRLAVVVPRGARFDVSVPRGLRWIVDPDDTRFLKAAALHDTLLAEGWDRVTAGAIFHEALRADGVTSPMRLAMWLAVSLWKWT
ncbi:DUF1353 domain-containing protein [Palleronia sp.]|uniref:DUF1353 domain-containing protein n=1 Tax=Palleronia sp. TaxID=1940284 RepID=UPI0035C85120